MSDSNSEVNGPTLLFVTTEQALQQGGIAEAQEISSTKMYVITQQEDAEEQTMKQCRTCKYAAVCFSTSFQSVFVCSDCRKLLGWFISRPSALYREVYLNYSCPIVRYRIKNCQLAVGLVRCSACVAVRRDKQ